MSDGPVTEDGKAKAAETAMSAIPWALGIPVYKASWLHRGEVRVMEDPRRILVRDPLRFAVRLDLTNYINRRVAETRERLGLGPS